MISTVNPVAHSSIAGKVMWLCHGRRSSGTFSPHTAKAKIESPGETDGPETRYIARSRSLDGGYNLSSASREPGGMKTAVKTLKMNAISKR